MHPPGEQRVTWFMSSCLLLVVTVASVNPAQQPTVTSSYGPTNQTETFGQIKAARMAVKAGRAKAHADLLSSRYVLDARADTSATAVKMSGGKPVPVGPTGNIAGVTWEQLGQMTPGQIRDQGLFPYKPLPFADHAEGGMLFYKQELANGMMMAHDGAIKTFPLRGIKDSPPYLHDGRCFTLEDTVEYFNLVLQLRLHAEEKKDLVAFLRAL
jgi:hypothetical protein